MGPVSVHAGSFLDCVPSPFQCFEAAMLVHSSPSIFLFYIEDKELRSGLSLDRLDKLMTNLTATSKTSIKNGSA